jgi:carbonic anhydrase
VFEEVIEENNRQFVNRIKEEEPNYFDELKKGQHPDYFVLSCSDSRVSPSVITNMPLGHMFIHRNIANQVSTHDASFSAGLYYALAHLKVKFILVEGHTDCGGVKAAWQGNDEGNLRTWLSYIRKSLPEKDEVNKLTEDNLAKINVLKQVENLKNHPVYKTHGQGVEIIGSLFHVESGELEVLNRGGDEPFNKLLSQIGVRKTPGSK